MVTHIKEMQIGLHAGLYQTSLENLETGFILHFCIIEFNFNTIVFKYYSCSPQFQPPENLSYPLPLPSFFLFHMLLFPTILALFLTPSLQFVKLFHSLCFPSFFSMGTSMLFLMWKNLATLRFYTSLF